MTGRSPRVSVLITAYNRKDFVGAAITSALASQFADIEVIVVDDHSTDGTPDAVGRFLSDSRVRFFRNEQNLGDNANRNRAAAEARGEYLKYVDSDDIMYPHALGVLVGAMDAFPEAGLGLSAVPDLSEPYPLCLSPREAFRVHFCERNLFGRAPGSAVIRRASFEAVGGFERFTGRGQMGDVDLWLRLASRFDVVLLPRDLVWNRVHPQTESAAQMQLPFDRTRAERELERRALYSASSPLAGADRELADRRLRERDAATILAMISQGRVAEANRLRAAAGVPVSVIARTLAGRFTKRRPSS